MLLLWRIAPYGEVYYKSIQQKLDAESNDGLFILEVSPWALCSQTEDPNDEAHFREADNFLAKMIAVNCNPNIEYLANYYSEPYIDLWVPDASPLLLHRDGWLEVRISMDSSRVAKRTDAKLADYRKNQLPHYKFSNSRFGYLKKTIALLKTHGRVVMVRMPVSSEMLGLENELLPGFDDRMKRLAEKDGVPYFNYSADGDQYRFTDGNHLWKESGLEFSEILGERIKER